MSLGWNTCRRLIGPVGVLALLWPLSAATQPRVRLIATGGTIGNHADGRLSATALAASVPTLRRIARVETETFSSVSSVELTLTDWLRLARRINDVLSASDVAGVVVTAGSDTLEELAWWLDLTVADGRPVVLTGAMRRPSDPDADGPRNLADAVRVAADPAARQRGAMVVMAGAILAARDAAKLSLTRLDAFGSTAAGVLGRLDQDRPRFRRPPLPRRSPRFDVARITELPRVDVLLTYQQAGGDLIDASVRAGARGLVLASAGAGAITPAQADAIETARRNEVPVVIASRVPHGTVAAGDVPKGTIPAGSLSPVKARILLMLALADGRSTSEIAQVFRE